MRHLVSAVALVVAAASSSAHAQNTLPQTNDVYFRAAQTALQERLRVAPNTSRAKNVILFVGDGMGISTVTAGRDRKSTRLNSSHANISHALFCLTRHR